MADISEYLTKIEQAIRGEDVRDAILAVFELINDGSNNAYTLNGHPASYFAKQSDMDLIIPVATEAILGNQRPISSGGVYDIIAKIIDALTKIMGESISGDITEQLIYLNDIKKSIRKVLISKQVDVDEDTKFSDYPDLIKDIPITAAIEVEPLDVTENGEYKLDPGYAYNPVTVDVKPKVGSKTISSTGTFNASNDGLDGYSSVTVSVSGAGGSGGSQSLSVTTKNITKDGTYNAADDKCLGYSSVTVDTKSELVTLEETVPPDPGSSHSFDLPSDISGWNKVTITVSEPVGPFTVQFYNKDKWLYTDNAVQAYQTCEYKGEPPTRKGMFFTGWEPPPVNVTKNMKCYAQFTAEQPKPGDQSDKTWEEIVADGGYSSVGIGEWKWLWYVDAQYDGISDPISGKIKMVKIGGAGPGYKSMWASGDELSVKMPFQSVSYVEKDGLKYISPISNLNGWENSSIRKFLNSELVSAIGRASGPDYEGSDLVAAHIATIPRYTAHYDPNTNTIVPNHQTDDAIWLPSFREITNKEIATGLLERGPYIDVSNVESDGLPGGGGIGSLPNLTRSTYAAGKFSTNERYDPNITGIDYIDGVTCSWSSNRWNNNSVNRIIGGNRRDGLTPVPNMAQSIRIMFCLN